MAKTILDRDLYIMVRKTLLRLGFSPSASGITARLMVESELRGFRHHGICRLAQIRDSIRNNTVSVKVKMTKVRDKGSIAVFDGHQSLGYCTSHYAMKKAISKAKRYGIGMVGVLNASHIGVLSCYSAMASRERCVGFACTTSSPAVVLPGGTEKIFGTNPISYSFPKKGNPIVADFSTSMTSRGTVLDALKTGARLPDNWGVDSKGFPTAIPSEILEGGIRTMDGGIKGALVSLLVSLLAGPLIGGEANDKIEGTRYVDRPPNKGDFFLAIDVEKTTDYDAYCEKLEGFCEMIGKNKSLFRIPGGKSDQFEPLQGGVTLEIDERHLLLDI